MELLSINFFHRAQKPNHCFSTKERSQNLQGNIRKTLHWITLPTKIFSNADEEAFTFSIKCMQAPAKSRLECSCSLANSLHEYAWTTPDQKRFSLHVQCWDVWKILRYKFFLRIWGKLCNFFSWFCCYTHEKYTRIDWLKNTIMT